ARRFETWENNYCARLGMGVAADYAMALGLERIEERCRMLARTLRNGLAGIEGVTVLDLGASPSAIVSFSVDGVPSEDFADAALADNIVIGTSSPSSTLLDSSRRWLRSILPA